MKHYFRISLILVFIPALLVACTLEWPLTATPKLTEPVHTITEIQQGYAAYADQLVRVRGYGILEMSVPLCPGYVGMDTRMDFVDEEENTLTAVLAGDIWAAAVKKDALRDFLGYVRIFSGETGCPGSLQTVIFPYLEIVEVEE